MIGRTAASLAVAAAAAALTGLGSYAFVPLSSSRVIGRNIHGAGAAAPDFLVATRRPALMVVHMSDDSGADTADAPKKRRRRRKDGRTAPGASEESEIQSETTLKTEESESEPKPAAAAAAAAAAPPAPIEKDTVVKMEVLDVRDALSGKTASTSLVSEDEEDDEEDVDDDDDDEYEWVYEDEEGGVGSSSAGGGAGLESLLADAKRMRAADASDESKSEGGGSSSDEESGGLSIPDSVGDVISTIVTVDFFIVCALLLWFLAGIFCSYVIKDDTVQIAFNNIFEPVVQPALGVLMIASAAGAVFKKDEEE